MFWQSTLSLGTAPANDKGPQRGLDPADDCTFWYTQEYYQSTSRADWKTRIGSFKFPSRGPDTTGPSTSKVVVSPNPTNVPPSITATVSDAGTGESNVVAAKLFLDTIGTDGTGIAMNPVDGSFNSATENVSVTLFRANTKDAPVPDHLP
jgi:hypothetical protein